MEETLLRVVRTVGIAKSEIAKRVVKVGAKEKGCRCIPEKRR